MEVALSLIIPVAVVLLWTSARIRSGQNDRSPQ